MLTLYQKTRLLYYYKSSLLLGVVEVQDGLTMFSSTESETNDYKRSLEVLLLFLIFIYVNVLNDLKQDSLQIFFFKFTENNLKLD